MLQVVGYYGCTMIRGLFLRVIIHGSRHWLPPWTTMLWMRFWRCTVVVGVVYCTPHLWRGLRAHAHPEGDALLDQL